MVIGIEVKPTFEGACYEIAKKTKNQDVNFELGNPYLLFET